MKTIRSIFACLSAAILVACGGPDEPQEKTNPTLNVSPSALPFVAEGGSGTVSITATGGSWNAKSDASWVSISPSSGGEGSATATVTVSANTGAARTATLTVSNGSASKTVSISQAAYEDPFAEGKIYIKMGFNKKRPSKLDIGEWPWLDESNVKEYVSGEPQEGYELGGITIEKGEDLDVPTTDNTLGFAIDEGYILIGGIELDQLTKAGETFGLRFTGSFAKMSVGGESGSGASTYQNDDVQVYVGEDNGSSDPGLSDGTDPADKWTRTDITFSGGAPSGKWSEASSEFAVQPAKVVTRATSTKIKLLIKGRRGIHFKDIKLVAHNAKDKILELSKGTSIGVGGNPTKFQVKDVKVSEFLQKSPSSYIRYRLAGTVSDLYNTTYGNFTLTDETGSVLVYGLTKNELGYGKSNDRSFGSLGIKNGDKVTLVGYRGVYGDKPEVVFAYHESHEAGKLEEYTVPEVMDASFKQKVPFKLKESIVVAVNARGFVVTDQSDKSNNNFQYIYVYKGSDHGVKIADKVTLTGDKTMYNGVPEIENVDNIQVVSSNNDYIHAGVEESRDFDYYSIDAVTLSEARLCRASGKLVKSGNYYNLTLLDITSLEDKGKKRKVSIQYPGETGIDFVGGGTKIDDYVGHIITVEGFWNGISKSGDQEYVNFIATHVGDLYLHDTPSGISRTSENMLVLDALVAAKGVIPGSSSYIVFADTKQGGYVSLKYSPSIEPLFNDCKVGDKFGMIYCYVRSGSADSNASTPKHFTYHGYYENLTSGNPVEYKYMQGPYTEGTELKKGKTVYFEATGTVAPGSRDMVLSDGTVLRDHCQTSSSILNGTTRRKVTARGFRLYYDKQVYCIFTSVQSSEEVTGMSIQEILNTPSNSEVKSNSVTVAAVASDGFVITEGAAASIFVDLSGMTAAQQKSLMPEVGDQVIVSGTKKSQLQNYLSSGCIGGSNVTVTKNGRNPDLIPEAEDVTAPAVYTFAKHVRIKGRVEQYNSTTFRLDYGGGSHRIQFYHPTSGKQDTLSLFAGKAVIVEGYYVGYSALTGGNLYHWVPSKIIEPEEDFHSDLEVVDGGWNGRMETVTASVNDVPDVKAFLLHDWASAYIKVPAGTEEISFYAVATAAGSIIASFGRISMPVGNVSASFDGRSPYSVTVSEDNKYTLKMGAVVWDESGMPSFEPGALKEDAEIQIYMQSQTQSGELLVFAVRPE